jgi:signal transduction histidine kinase
MKTRATILIVDDRPTNLGVLFECLDTFGYKVRVANSGESALESIRHTPPDLILLDVMMPGIDGFEVCRRLKADKESRDIPIIFMTALSETTDEVKGLRLGAVDYITKPFQAEIVLARINTQLTLRNLQKQLQKQNEDLDSYARTVAHDLKNPLTGILSSVNYITGHFDEIGSEELQEYLQVIQSSSTRALSIIDELLVMASMRHGGISLQTLDMSVVIQQVQERLSRMLNQYNGKLIVPETWPVATGYQPWIEAVWFNYISNGLKYGGQPPRLELGATPQADGMVRFWVRDNGSGLSPADQAKLFAEFSRLNSTNGRAIGHGLGLSIVRRIVEKLGGQVGVESEVGQGSRFFFTLPSA